MKRLNPKGDRVTIILPKSVLDEIKKKTTGSREFNSWILFALLKSLKDESFVWDLRQSEEYLDQQLEL